jgi:hypothetical protein
MVRLNPVFAGFEYFGNHGANGDRFISDDPRNALEQTVVMQFGR